MQLRSIFGKTYLAIYSLLASILSNQSAIASTPLTEENKADARQIEELSNYFRSDLSTLPRAEVSTIARSLLRAGLLSLESATRVDRTIQADARQAQITDEQLETLQHELEARVGWSRLSEFYSELSEISDHSFGGST